MESKNKDVVIIGEGSLIIPCGEYLIENDFEIVGLVTSDNDNIEWGKSHSIRIIPENALNEIEGMEFDFLFSIVYLKKLPKEIINKAKVVAINYHDALLPRYAGIHATSWALLGGEKKHGITWHVMEEKLDTGKILVQKEVEVVKGETAVSLNIKCFQAAVEGFYELIDSIVANNVIVRPQNISERSYYGKWKKPARGGIIDWSNDCEEIIHLVNALDFGDYENTLAVAKFVYKGKFYIVNDIKQSESIEFRNKSSFGIVQDNTLYVTARDGVLKISSILNLDGEEESIRKVFSEENTFFSLETDDNQVEKIQERIAEISPKEPYWVNKYHKYNMNYSQWESIIESPVKYKQWLDYSGKESNKLEEKLLLSIAMVLLSHGCTGKQYIGYCDTSVNSYSLFGEILPIEINCDQKETVETDVLKEFAAVRENKTYLKDMFARYPSIKEKGIIPYITVYRTKSTELSPRSEINLIVNPDTKKIGIRCRNRNTIEFAKTIIERVGELERENDNFKTVYQLVQEQIGMRGDKTAIVAGKQHVSYQELGDRIDKRAAMLWSKGIRRGMNVGVLLSRNHEVIITFLALQKIAAVYIPMDSTYPLERLRFMTEDAQITYLITEHSESKQFRNVPFETIYIEDDKEVENIGLEPERIRGKEPVYILYTSGSTGKPKGVVVNHLGLANFLLSMQKEPGFAEHDVLLSVTTVCFDISGLELYLPLISGGTTYIVPSEVTNDGILLRELIESVPATVIQATPATWEMLFLAGWEKKLPLKILCGGEGLAIELADRLLKQCDELWNMYGPTETTIWSTIKHITDKNNINIGKPIDNTQVWIFDKNMRAVQRSQAGELYIGGYGVANGYYRREEMTAERFIENPLLKGDRIYKTGDLVKMNEAGELVYLGRIDNQVKYHGFRIELEEIERVMQEKLDLEKAIVVIRKDDLNQDGLYAFIQTRSEFNREDNEKILREFLPHYMIPCEFIRVKSYPLTMNKKINRKYLTSLPISKIQDKYGWDISKQSQSESLNNTVDKISEVGEPEKNLDEYVEIIREIASEVLKKRGEDLDNDKNFGYYGFNSVRFTILCTRINKRLETKITPADCYKYDTIDSLAEYIECKRKEGDKGSGTRKIELLKTDIQFIQDDVNATQEKIRRIVADLIKVPLNEIQSDNKLSMYGFNSVRFTVLCSRINKELHMRITPADCYKYKTIEELTNYILGVENSKEVRNEDREQKREECSSINGEDSRKSDESPISEAKRDSDNHDIAIIGLGLKLPHANTMREYWNLINRGECVIQNIPSDRWESYGDNAEGNKSQDYAALLDDIWGFDASFFHISPREAAQMDPQQRLFLQASWEAIEDAGYNPEALAGEVIAVYAGAVESDYYNQLSKNRDNADIFTISGNIQCGIANRVSYVLDFHGESETINSACSSSLVAINHAVKSINRGECSMALAGGVNVILNPFMHYALKKNGMLSPDGRCKSFDSRANGYVRGEGCGVILLKPLNQACKDGDHIYAVIKGSEVNHDGMTSSFTAPNPVSQANLVENVYRNNGIDANLISYIETHGTGTKLGDPIEINALKDAFSNLFKKQEINSVKQYCGLGSVKANIGHLEAAAGIASILKVILQMKYKVIPKIAELQRVNPYIEIQDSPFYLPKENKTWEGIIDRNGKRRWIAGVSSFGFGGTNAHIILESYEEKQDKELEEQELLFPFSNETDEGLHQYVKKMADYFEESIKVGEEKRLADISGVLQYGRCNRRFRVAFIAKNMKQLVDKMHAYLQGDCQNGIYSGTNSDSHILETLLDGKSGAEYLKILYNNCIEKIAQLWVMGLTLKWEDSRKIDYRKLSLPTYEFRKDTFRVSILGRNDAGERRKNTLEETFISPNIPYIKDHIIDEMAIFPGAMYLKLAAQSAIEEDNFRLTIRDNRWIKAKVVNKDDTLYVERTKEGEWTHYAIHSGGGDAKVLHACGEIKVGLENDSISVNLDEIRKKCSNQIGRAQIYALYSRFGFDYGLIYQTLIEVLYNETEYLSRIDLGDESDENIRFIRLIEGGMQATIASFADDIMPMRFIPVGIQECNIYSLPHEIEVYAHAKLINSYEVGNVITKEFDIDIMDSIGTIYVQLNGYKLQVSKGRNEKKESTLSIYRPQYDEVPILESSRSELMKNVLVIDTSLKKSNIVQSLAIDYSTEIISNALECDKRMISEKIKYADAVIIYSDENSDAYEFLLDIAKACIQLKREVYIMLMYEKVEGDCCYKRAVRGFANCYNNENTKSFFKVVELENSNYSWTIAQEIFRDDYSFISYKNGCRYVEKYEKIAGGKELIQDDSGCYVITGGTGHLGMMIAKQLYNQYPEIKLVLIGRNKGSESVDEVLRCSNRVEVIATDISNSEEVRKLVDYIHSTYGEVKGLFHAAGLVNDAYIYQKRYMDANNVISTKTKGIYYFDYYLREDNLDFMVLFSSISTLIGNAGQSDYCYANEYLNAFSEYRNELVNQGKRNGNTISINWGFWKDGGMLLHEAEIEMLRRKDGIIPMSSREGIEFLLNCGHHKNTVFAVRLENDHIFRDDARKEVIEEISSGISEREGESVDLTKKVNDALKTCCSKVIRLDESKIIMSKELSEYGLDSLTTTELANEINEELGTSLTPVVFFEYTNLASLADYIRDNYANEVMNVLQDDREEKQDKLAPEEKKEVYEFQLDTKSKYAQGHTVYGNPVILGVTYISHFLECLHADDASLGEFQSIMFHEAATVKQNDYLRYKVVKRFANGGISFKETCENERKPFTVVTGIFKESQSENSNEKALWQELINSGRVVTGADVYERKWKYDVLYTDEMQSVEKVWLKNDVVLGKLSISPLLQGSYRLNPMILDGAMVCGLFAFLENVPESFIPYSIKKVIVRNNPAENCYCICKKRYLTDEILSMDISIMDDDGTVVVYMQDFVCKKVVNKKHFISSGTGDSEKVNNDIAIIGMSASFAGSENVDEYWEILREMKDCIKEIPSDHFEYREYYDPESHGNDKMYTKWGGFIENVDKFDASFFNISRREAEVMDPQIRHLLQHTYHAAEDAGYSSILKGSNTGMYVGCCFHDYQQKMDRQKMKVSPHDLTGNALTMLANRTSYCLDLKGPSVNVDTACSSSLVALHMACQGLRNNECEMAFVGGANLLLDSWHYRYFCSIGALSKTGRCHTFSDKADGYIPGEGIAVLMLKPLENAMRDRDNIYGVIKGSAINHGGMTTSITAPDINQEAKVITSAWRAAGIKGNDVSYIEAHGTGTKLGDPIEINALKKVFKETKETNQPCYLGSAKASIGHTEGAAGLAGVIKVLLSMKKGLIPAMPFFRDVNPYIQLEESNLIIPDGTVEWKPRNGVKVAGVSSFGAGGAYAHVVIEEFKAPESEPAEKAERLIILSAKTEKSLKQSIKNLLDYLQKEGDRNNSSDSTWLRDISYSLMVGREQLNVRLAFCVNGIIELMNVLNEALLDSGKGYSLNKLSQDDLLSKNKITGEDDLSKIERLWLNGNLISTDQVRRIYNKACRISLPGYSFEKNRYWIKKSQEDVKYKISKNDFFISNHVIDNINVMPGVAYLEYVIREATKKGIVVGGFANVCYIAPLMVGDKDIELRVDIKENRSFLIDSWDGKQCIHHVQGDIIEQPIELEEKRKLLSGDFEKIIYGDEFYEDLSKHGLCIGRAFRSVRELKYSKTELIAKISLSSELENTFDMYELHPAVFDGVLQAVVSRDNDSCLHIPFEIGELKIARHLQKDVIVFGRKDTGLGKWNIIITDSDCNVIMTIEGLVSKASKVNRTEKSAKEEWLVDVLTKLTENELSVSDVENML